MVVLKDIGCHVRCYGACKPFQFFGAEGLLSTRSMRANRRALPCSSKHWKPVCDKCTAGTNCTKCCLCQSRSRGRPRKDSVSSDSETLARSNPERRQARIHHDTFASASSAVDMTPSIHVSDDRLEHVQCIYIASADFEGVGANGL